MRIVANLPSHQNGVQPIDPVEAGDVSLAQIPGGVRWDFPNGITVGYAPSDIAPDYVSVYAESEGGWSLLPEGSSAYTDLVIGAVSRSGLADIDTIALNRYLADKQVALSPFIGETVDDLPLALVAPLAAENNRGRVHAQSSIRRP